MIPSQSFSPETRVDKGAFPAPIVIVFYLSPKFALLDFSSALEALRFANQMLGYEAYRWRIVSDAGGAVAASCGLPVVTDSSVMAERRQLLDGGRPRMVAIFADHGVETLSNKATDAWLRECSHHKVIISAFGTGSYILAKAGLLANKKCTIHWTKLPVFNESFMHIETSKGIFQTDGNIWTCAGGSASLDMMLYFIQQDFDEETVAGICQHSITERVRTHTERQRLPLSLRHGTTNEVVIKLVDCMENHVISPLSMDDLALRVGRSRRQVERLFRSELGRSPVRYYRELRLERAHLLITQSEMPILDVAVTCGFVSASHFSKCFREINGMSPHAARRERVVPKHRHASTLIPAVLKVA